MTRDQIDIMWNQALQQSIKDGEQFTRYHFAAMVAAAEREACTNALRELTLDHKSSDYYQGWLDLRDAGEAAIRARSKT